MPATITGKVFNDLNRNGVYDAGEPGISGAYIILYGPSGCTSAQTNANGDYGFSVMDAGNYTIYETVAAANSCPPTFFTQPAGFTASNTARNTKIALNTAQINANAVIDGQNFGHDTQADELDCTSEMIQFADRPTNWYDVNLVTGASTLRRTLNPPANVNAIGYNITDRYIYGYSQTTNTLVRVGSNGDITLLPRPDGLPIDTYNAGTLDTNGFYYLYVSNRDRFYTVDMRPNSPTYLRLVDPANGYQEQTINFGTLLSTPINIHDLVYHPYDGMLYGIDQNGVMQRIYIYSGAVAALNTSGPNPGAPFGALAIDARGNIYAVSDSDGSIYRYIITGDTAQGLRTGTTHADTFNDGTMCPYAEVLIDFGDAPDAGSGTGAGNYNTLLTNDGPRHGLVNNLFLGTQVTAEDDAYQNATATGDDIIQGIQDDGLAVPLNTLYVNASFYDLNVLVTNNTGLTAYLYGWIDFNRNGIFEPDEAAPVQAIPPSGTTTIPLHFIVPPDLRPTPSHTFVRLRLTSEVLTDVSGGTGQDTRSVGPAADGEVEDYILGIGSIADLSVVKTADLSVLNPGDQITYTIVVTNYGPNTAEQTTLTDEVSPYLHTQEYSLDNGSTWQPWNGSYFIGDMNAGDSVTILIRGIYDGGATDSIENTAIVTAVTEDGDDINNQSTVITPVAASADLSITKTADPDPALTGQYLTYTIEITNAGPSEATDVILSDNLPSQLMDGEYSLNNGATWYPWTGNLNIGSIQSNTTVTVLLRGIVDQAATGSILNTASVSSSVPDPDPYNNDVSITTPIEDSADISVTKSSSPNPVQTGQTLTYTLEVGNAGPAAAENVVLTDDIPNGLTNVTYSTDGVSWLPWTGSLSIGSIAAGTVITVQIRGTVSPAEIGPITNTAMVESSTHDPDTDNNTDTNTTDVDTSADLSIIKTGAPNPVAAGGLLTYTIVVTNFGPSDAQDVEIIDPVPGSLSNVEYSTDNGNTWNTWTGAYQTGTLPSLTNITILIRGIVASDATGTLTNTATVTSTTPDPDLDNNSSTIITGVDAAADVSVVKTGTPNPAVTGQLLMYTIRAYNSGPSLAQNVVISDDVPFGLSNLEYSTDGISWFSWPGAYTINQLEASGYATLFIRGTVTATSGTIINTVRVTSDTPDPNPNNNEYTEITPINESADLSITKTTTSSAVVAGDLLTYTVTIVNNGPAIAENVTLTDNLPAELLDGQISLDGINWLPWSDSFNLGAIAAGQSYTFRIRGRVDPETTSGAITNTAFVDSTTPDPNPDNNSDTTTISVEHEADVAIIKTANPSPAVPGQTLTYTLKVTNYGPSAATGVEVADPTPAVLQNPTYSLDNGVTFAPWNGRYAIGNLAAGATITLLIRGTVSPLATGQITNTATVTSTTTDPNLNNNSSETVTQVQESADVSIIKTSSPNPVPARGQITYTFTVSNAGPTDAVNVIVTDSLPDEVKNPQFSIDGGTTWFPWTGSYNIGTLYNGSTRRILVRGTVETDTAMTLSNTATVTSSTPDHNPDNNTYESDTEVVESADLIVTKEANVEAVTPGEEVIYTVTVANNGAADAEEVILRDEIPADISNVYYSTDGQNWSPWISPYAMGLIANGETRIIYIRGIVNANVSDHITNTVYVTATTPDPDTTNNVATDIRPVQTSADVSMTKTASSSSITPGEIITYTLTAANAGPSAADNVVIYDTLTGITTNTAEYSTDGGTVWRPWTGSYAIGTLNSGASRSILVRGIAANTDSCFIQNTASVTSTTPDPDPGNNTSTVVIQVVHTSDLCINKTACPCSAVPGQRVNFELTVRNLGPDSANNVVLTDIVPNTLYNVQYSADGGITWDAWNGSYSYPDTLMAGGCITILLRAEISCCASCDIVNTAFVFSSSHDPVPANNISTACIRLERRNRRSKCCPSKCC